LDMSCCVAKVARMNDPILSLKIIPRGKQNKANKFLACLCAIVLPEAENAPNLFLAVDPAGRDYGAPLDPVVDWEGDTRSQFPPHSMPAASRSGLKTLTSFRRIGGMIMI